MSRSKNSLGKRSLEKVNFTNHSATKHSFGLPDRTAYLGYLIEPAIPTNPP